MFLRALGCVTSRFRKLRSGRLQGLQARAAPTASPSTRTARWSRRTRAYRNRDDVNLASLGRLEAALDRLQRAGRLRATTRRFNLYLDEYGYQTRPPDRTAGVSLATQDRWLQRAAYRAWRDPRVRLLDAVPVVRRAAAARRQRVRRLAVGPALPRRARRSPRSRTSTRRCSSMRRAAGCGARRGPAARRP